MIRGRATRIRTILLPLAAVLVVALAGAGARADFHPACAGIVTGDAWVDLDANGDGTFTWLGTVTCPGAERVDVTVTLSRVSPLPDEFTPETATASCTVPCIDPVTASGTSALTDGTYRVEMRFDAAGPGVALFTYQDVPRCGEWMVSGTSASGPDESHERSCSSGGY